MEIAQEKRGAVSVLGPVGRLDTDSAADLELAIQDMLAAGAQHFVVDLERINYVSSAGLRVLLMLAKSTDGKGSLRIAGLNAQVQQVFDIAGFTRLFRIYPDREAALRDHPAAGEAEAPAPAAPAKPVASEAPKRASEMPATEAAKPAADPPKPAAEAPKPVASTQKSAPESAGPPREAPKPAPEVPKAAPAPPVSPAAAHAARLLGAGPAPDGPIDPGVKALARHAAMLLGAKLDAGGERAAPMPKAVASRPAPAAPATEPAEEKAGFFGRLFGKRKRTPGV